MVDIMQARHAMMAVSLLVVLAISVAGTPSTALPSPSEVLIGVQFPIFKAKPPEYAIDNGGRRRFAAFLMALREVNNKTDGIMDSILPNTEVKFAFYDSKRDSGHAMLNAMSILNSARLPQNVRRPADIPLTPLLARGRNSCLLPRSPKDLWPR